MSTETLMKVLGIFHTTFGGLVMLLQGCCAFAGWFWTNYPYNLFEDMFLPGLWIGIPIFCLGVACILQFRFPRSWLHKLITVFTSLVIVNSSFMLAFKIHFLIDDPEAEMYHDCANPFAPYNFGWTRSRTA
ncbi:hypothetical protein BV898_01534 [Hypsibius exemplaris]|uniref:Uncharacterized protein n=1 Tax=Hypsibius exemplaris TaxID=2072580 RepID=A0A1W0XAN7_HYPEX|nr:hypothetical protein BV898_01534 [Hypsibius exemplaris]